MQRLVHLLIASALVAGYSPLHAERSVGFAETIEIVEEIWTEDGEAGWTDPIAAAPALGEYGPFRVIDAGTAQMIGETDTASPDHFRRMIAANPGIHRLEMIECPGTVDDEANLALARLVRQAGIETHVPAGGSVRSGAVELFLAGVRRTAAPDAEFAVHSWRDVLGREADDVPANDPVNLAYIAYYREMGLDAGQARAFYDFTNSAPHEAPLWIGVTDMARFGLIDGDLKLDLALASL